VAVSVRERGMTTRRYDRRGLVVEEPSEHVHITPSTPVDPEAALANVSSLLGLLQLINDGLGRAGNAVRRTPLPKKKKKHPGLKEAMVDALPYILLTEPQLQKTPECVVCCEDLKRGEVGMEIPCSHVFHPDCIIPWFEDHDTCPLCRAEVTKKAVKKLSCHALRERSLPELMELPLRELQRQVYVKGGAAKGTLRKEVLAEMVLNAPGKELFSSDSGDSSDDEAGGGDTASGNGSGNGVTRRRRRTNIPGLQNAVPTLGLRQSAPERTRASLAAVSPRIAAIAVGAIASGISNGEALSPRRTSLAAELAGQLDTEEIMRLANGNLMTNRPVYADPTEASNRRRESRQRLSEAILGTGELRERVASVVQ
jgi:hypothetical protein